MGAWDIYKDRMRQIGCSKREMWVRHTKESVYRRIMESPSCKRITINGREQLCSITHKADMNIKGICALPGEHLVHGGLVEFANHRWLITEMDADAEIYEKGIMTQCNHVLRWIGKDGMLKEKWCIVEDGTKYLTGEFSEDIMSVGDARIALTISKDEDTIELSRGMRFLIDDNDSDSVIAYQITKPNRLFNIYNGAGVYKFILTEVNLTDQDNKQLRIADYTNWKPTKVLDGDHEDSELTIGEIVSKAEAEASVPPSDDKKGWL